MSEQPQKILMTADTVGGVWIYSLELARELSKKNIEIHLATMGKKLTRDQWFQADQIPKLIIHESEYKLEWMEQAWQDVDAAGKWLLSLEERIQPDIVHLNNFCHGSLSFKAPVVVVGHSCMASWWKAVKKQPLPSYYEEYKNRVKAGIKGADFFVAVSQAIRQEFQKNYGSLGENKVIYNGRRPRDYRGKKKLPFVFSMGRVWDEAKNLSLVDDLGDKLIWPVKIAGNNIHPETGGERPVNHVKMLGQINQDDVKEQLATAAIYALPAKYEPFGLSVLEAALSECALVLSDIPTFRELWQDAALFAEPDDVIGWANAINEVARNVHLRSRLSKLARLRALDYSSDIMASKYLGVYRELQKEQKKKEREAV